MSTIEMRRTDYPMECCSTPTPTVGSALECWPAWSRAWFNARINEILFRKTSPIPSDAPIPVDETEFMKIEVWPEVYTINQCADNYFYLTGRSLWMELCRTLTKKNADYSKEDNAFSNLMLCEQIWVAPSDWIKVRMCDKISRIRNLIDNLKEPAVTTESLADSWLDLAWYLVIAYLYDEYITVIWQLETPINQK